MCYFSVFSRRKAKLLEAAAKQVEQPAEAADEPIRLLQASLWVRQASADSWQVCFADRIVYQTSKEADATDYFDYVLGEMKCIHFPETWGRDKYNNVQAYRRANRSY